MGSLPCDKKPPELESPARDGLSGGSGPHSPAFSRDVQYAIPLMLHRPFLNPPAHQGQEGRVLIKEGRVVARHTSPNDPCRTCELAKEIAVVGIARGNETL